MTREELKAAAAAMLDRAYIPYSHFPVGAALERVAVGKAVSEGHRDFVRIAVAGRCEDFCVPCAVCRQVLYEFAPDMEVISLNGKGEELALTLRELLPHGFGPKYLLKEE